MTRLKQLNNAKLKAKEWRARCAQASRAIEQRDRTMFNYIAITAKIGRTLKIKSAKKFIKLIKRTCPSLDTRSRSRYAGVVRAVALRKPPGESVRKWVRRNGGIGRCR